MAKTIELRTELPGPKSREILAAQGARDRRCQEHLPADRDRPRPRHRRHRRRRQHLPRLDRRHRLPQRRAHQRGGLARRCTRRSTASCTPTSRWCPTSRTSSWPSGCSRVTPISGPKKAAFFNSGAEAVENAVKLAKLATGRPAVIAFERAFHGRTLMAMSLTSKQHPYKAGMGPFAPEVYRAPYPYAYRGRRRRPAAGRAGRAARDVHHPRRARERGGDHLRAGAGRGRLRRCPPRSGCEGLREIADEHGIVLIADEVQSGFGRTGKMFAIEHFGVEPDLITVAKSIAAGRAHLRRARPRRDRRRRRRQHDRRHLRRLAAGLRGRHRRAGGDRAARPAGARTRDRRADARRAFEAMQATAPAAGRRARPGPDAGARVRQGSGDQGAGARAGDGRRRGRDAARADDPQGRDPRASACACWLPWSRPTSRSTRRSTSSKRR